MNNPEYRVQDSTKEEGFINISPTLCVINCVHSNLQYSKHLILIIFKKKIHISCTYYSNQQQ